MFGMIRLEWFNNLIHSSLEIKILMFGMIRLIFIYKMSG